MIKVFKVIHFGKHEYFSSKYIAYGLILLKHVKNKSFTHGYKMIVFDINCEENLGSSRDHTFYTVS